MFAGDYCGGMGPAGWLLMIGFWAAVIAVIVWAVTRLFPKESTATRVAVSPRPLSKAGIDLGPELLRLPLGD